MQGEKLNERAVLAPGIDPRVAELEGAVARLRVELAAHPALLRDRQVAEEELAALDAMVVDSVPDIARLRGALLLTAAALGSVSALAAPLAALRRAVELFGEPPRV